MTPHYQLIDLTSGNVVGDYDTEAEALGDLRQAADTHGWGSIRDYSLMRIEHDAQSVVATQHALVLLARQHQPVPTANVAKTVA
jgi:hypothetical protein